MADRYGREIIKGKSGLAFYEYSSWCHRTKTVGLNGKIIYGKIKGFATEEEAVESHYKCLEEFEKQWRDFNASVNKDILLKDYLIYWFENVYSERIETTTKMVGAYIIYNLIIPNMDYDVKVYQATPDYINTITERAFKQTDSGGYSSRAILSMAFKDALVGGYINYNPIPETKFYQRPKPKIMVYNEKQMKKFLKGCQKTSWYLEILIALFCGLRKGEILGLKFSDIDFKNNTLKVQRQLVYDPKLKEKSSKVSLWNVIERDPKTENSIRRLRIPEDIMAEIIRRKEQVDILKVEYGDNYIDNDYVTCMPDGKPRCITSINNSIKNICRGVSLPSITTHGLRHMCATLLLEQGEELAKISAFLGHTSIHTTFEYYCEVMDDKEKILAFMNEVFAVEGSAEDYGFGNIAEVSNNTVCGLQSLCNN